jgi:hypothetical protein
VRPSAQHCRHLRFLCANILATTKEAKMLDDLRDDQWEIIKNILPGKNGDRGRTG